MSRQERQTVGLEEGCDMGFGGSQRVKIFRTLVEVRSKGLSGHRSLVHDVLGNHPRLYIGPRQSTVDHHVPQTMRDHGDLVAICAKPHKKVGQRHPRLQRLEFIIGEIESIHDLPRKYKGKVISEKRIFQEAPIFTLPKHTNYLYTLVITLADLRG